MSTKSSLSARFSKLLHRRPSSPKRHDSETSGDDGTNDGLCDICKKIDFSNKDRSKTPVALGVLGELRQRSSSCPFCNLVLRAMQDERIIHMQPISHYESHTVRVFPQVCDRFAIQPLPSYSRVLFESDIRGFDKVVASSQIDFAMVKDWLHKCEAEHKDCLPNEGPFNVDLSFFRCIDVMDMCIVPVPIKSPYVALSYKWGDCKPFLLLESNKDDLFAKDGLRRNWVSIPKTIQDSIDFVRAIGCRYVWIDQVCLIQDNDDDRGTGINAMDLVYEQAHFTIIAASGKDADSGLPGVREGSRSASGQIRTEVVPGVHLALRHTMQDMLSKAEYHHRGWTFQEYYLSRRRIIFLDDSIYFKCLQATWQELEDGLPAKSESTAAHGQALHKPSGDVYHLLGQLLNQYTTRELKVPSDYVPAMAGICRRLADYAQCSLLFGIPVAALDWFLLFYPDKNGLKRRDAFPSWAWSGWYGKVYYNFGSGDVTKWTESSTWIIWHKRDSSGVLTPVLDKAERRGPRAIDLFGQLCDVSQAEPLADVATGRQSAVLQFWTVALSLSLQNIGQEKGEKMMWSYGLYWTPTTIELLDRNGTTCGFVTLDDPVQPDRDGRSAELILLSLSAEKASASKSAGEEPAARFFWVVMVEWTRGVAERKGIGKINRDALTSSLDPGVVWKEIVLA
ncbi:heterokaryon incompatibility protein-domain-containing protein [Xylariaceae sp. FL0594]|nr:heterokaryon incompatibility protein-domain-containing protein [Xylariaceae sp. FL0594]